MKTIFCMHILINNLDIILQTLFFHLDRKHKRKFNWLMFGANRHNWKPGTTQATHTATMFATHTYTTHAYKQLSAHHVTTFSCVPYGGHIQKVKMSKWLWCFDWIVIQRWSCANQTHISTPSSLPTNRQNFSRSSFVVISELFPDITLFHFTIVKKNSVIFIIRQKCET